MLVLGFSSVAPGPSTEYTSFDSGVVVCRVEQRTYGMCDP